LQKNAEHFSCEVNNQLVGTHCCYMNNTNSQTTVYAKLTCINPKYFGLGIAKKTNRKLYAYKIGYKYIEMQINKNNFRSVKIHLKINYEIINEDNDSYFF
jgi:hypothetical protein